MQNVRFRVDLSPACSIGPGKVRLLEGIARTGSLRQAAVQLGMSYRRAWLLLDQINHAFSERATLSSVGGRGGGGVTLTKFGGDLVRRYRSAARRIEAVVKAEFSPLASKARTRPSRALRPARKRLARSERSQ